MICPCKSCEERRPACHDVCEKYKAWQAHRRVAAIRRQKENEVTDAIIRGKLRVAKEKGRDKR